MTRTMTRMLTQRQGEALSVVAWACARYDAQASRRLELPPWRQRGAHVTIATGRLVIGKREAAALAEAGMVRVHWGARRAQITDQGLRWLNAHPAVEDYARAGIAQLTEADIVAQMDAGARCMREHNHTYEAKAKARTHADPSV